VESQYWMKVRLIPARPQSRSTMSIRELSQQLSHVIRLRRFINEISY